MSFRRRGTLAVDSTQITSMEVARMQLIANLHKSRLTEMGPTLIWLDPKFVRGVNKLNFVEALEGKASVPNDYLEKMDPEQLATIPFSKMQYQHFDVENRMFEELMAMENEIFNLEDEDQPYLLKGSNFISPEIKENFKDENNLFDFDEEDTDSVSHGKALNVISREEHQNLVNDARQKRLREQEAQLIYEELDDVQLPDLNKMYRVSLVLNSKLQDNESLKKETESVSINEEMHENLEADRTKNQADELDDVLQKTDHEVSTDILSALEVNIEIAKQTDESLKIYHDADEFGEFNSFAAKNNPQSLASRRLKKFKQAKKVSKLKKPLAVKEHSKEAILSDQENALMPVAATPNAQLKINADFPKIDHLRVNVDDLKDDYDLLSFLNRVSPTSAPFSNPLFEEMRSKKANCVNIAEEKSSEPIMFQKALNQDNETSLNNMQNSSCDSSNSMMQIKSIFVGNDPMNSNCLPSRTAAIPLASQLVNQPTNVVHMPIELASRKPDYLTRNLQSKKSQRLAIIARSKSKIRSSFVPSFGVTSQSQKSEIRYQQETLAKDKNSKLISSAQSKFGENPRISSSQILGEDLSASQKSMSSSQFVTKETMSLSSSSDANHHLLNLDAIAMPIESDQLLSKERVEIDNSQSMLNCDDRIKTSSIKEYSIAETNLHHCSSTRESNNLAFRKPALFQLDAALPEASNHPRPLKPTLSDLESSATSAQSKICWSEKDHSMLPICQPESTFASFTNCSHALASGPSRRVKRFRDAKIVDLVLNEKSASKNSEENNLALQSSKRVAQINFVSHLSRIPKYDIAILPAGDLIEFESLKIDTTKISLSESTFQQNRTKTPILHPIKMREIASPSKLKIFSTGLVKPIVDRIPVVLPLIINSNDEIQSVFQK